VNVRWSLAHGELAGANPWQASTLEWDTQSPPPDYNFSPIPYVEGREPVWSRTGDAPRVLGMHNDRREVLVTTLDAEPQLLYEMPGPTIWPFILAVTSALGLIGSVFNPWWIVIGAGPVLVAFVGWYWPRRRERTLLPEEAR
jgi:cytochrome c oxidase subunit 1